MDFAKRTLAQILHGLQAIHTCGVIHRYTTQSTQSRDIEQERAERESRDIYQ